MVKSYLKIGIRSAIRHRLNSSINIIGLALAVGCMITISMFVDHQYHADTFHDNIDRIYQVTNLISKQDGEEEWSDTPILLGPALMESASSIESMTRVEYSTVAVRYDQNVFSEFTWFVDPSFLQMFSFPVVAGDVAALQSKEQIIIEQALADKYFGSSDPIGRVMSMKFANGKKLDFVVGAVMRRPSNSSLYMNILMSMEVFEDIGVKDVYDWNYLTDATFLMVKPGASIDAVAESMSRYQELQNAASPEWTVDGFRFQPLRGLAAKGQSIVGAVSNGAHPAGLLSLLVIGFLLLLLASFNYMNVAVATAATRLKEIGIRKVIGGRKKEIIQQFLTENFLMCGLSVGVGALLSYWLFLPGFNSLYPIKTPFQFTDPLTAVLVFGGILVFAGLISGGYPAFYISSFTPISVLRGKEKFGQRGLFSRILLTLQFVLAFTAVVASFVFIDNSLYLKNKDWGYNHDLNIVVPVNNLTQFLALRDKAVGQGEIAAVAGAANHIGYQNTRNTFEHLGRRHEAVHYRVGFGYPETMNLRLQSGRFFDRSIQSDEQESVLVNESFVRMMGWENGLEQSFEYDSSKRYVVGVIGDFHYEGFYDPLGPVMFSISPDTSFRYLTAKAAAGSVGHAKDFLEKSWREVAPDDPYEGFLQDEVFENFYSDNNANIRLLSFISGIAILLGCLGLFGLVSFNITRRLKEFCVRKVFGANTPHLFRLMSRDYMWILLIAFGIGAPTGFFLMNFLIQHIYPDPQPAGILPFAAAISAMAITVGITVASQMRRVVRENPAETLRIE
jgi:ABC-type antimicrobial peptide transport system permease subunit